MSEEKDKKKDLSIIYIETGIFVLTFLVHILFILKIQAPQYVDEYRTFLTGEFLAGRYDLSLLHAYEETNMYYGFGQVLFYIPFFWIFHSMDTVFKAALVFNGIVMSLVPVLALKIFRTLLSEYSEIERAGLAFAVGMFSPLIYQSKTVTNETFLLFFPVLILYLLVALSVNENQKKKIVLSALLGLCGMWMYTLNARGLAITFSVFICVAYTEIVKWSKKISLLSYAVASVVVYIINHFISKYIVRSFHHPFSGTGVRNNEIKFLSRIKQLHISGFFTAVSSWSGNWFYIVAVSGGLIALLLAAVFVNKKQEAERNIFIYALANTIVTCGMLFGVNYNTFCNPKTAKIDRYIYGRYYDLLIPVILIVGLYFLVRYANLLRTYITAIFVIGCTGVLGTVCFANILIKTGSQGIRILNIGTLTAFLGDSFAKNPSRLHFFGISIVIMIIYTILTLSLKKKKPFIAVILLSSCFLFATSYVMTSCKETSAFYRTGVEGYRSMISGYEELDESYKTIYYLYDGKTDRGVNIQYALRDWKIVQVDIESDYNMDLNMIEQNTFILTKTEMLLDLLYEDCKLIKEENGAFLYAYGQDLIEKLSVEKEERNGIPVHLLLDGGNENSSLLIVEGAQSYGPYLELDAGTYYVEIYGSHLGTASVQITQNFAVDLIESNTIEQTEEKICLQFSADSAMKGMEIHINNTDKQYIVIDNLCIYDERDERIFITDEKNLYLTVQAYYIASDEKIYLNPVLLDAGKYLIRIEGMNVKHLRLTSADLPDGYIRERESGENYIVYELGCEGFVKYPSILIESQIDMEKYIESITISRINS